MLLLRRSIKSAKSIMYGVGTNRYVTFRRSTLSVFGIHKQKKQYEWNGLKNKEK